ncbi:rubredoxin [Bradyrhizobium sp. DASA03120]|uniref:rubredoxin n=1 Tax=Bradyrhizobium sp. SMVTL-02 TaxID=3395917 RepID=UPI003F705FA6
MSGFEKCSLRQDLTEGTRLECAICWTVYDPVDGDAVARIAPGTPFAALPEDWCCPNCDAPKSKLMAMAVAPVAAEDRLAELRLLANCKEAVYCRAPAIGAIDGRNPLCGVLTDLRA